MSSFVYVCPTCGLSARFSGPCSYVMCPEHLCEMPLDPDASAPEFALIASDAIPDGLRGIDALMRHNGRYTRIR